MYQKCDIVVIDSGLNTKHSFFKNQTCKGISIIFDEGAGNYSINDNFEDNIGHGTAVYYLLKKCIKEADVFVLKLFDKNTEPDVMSIIFALEYVYANIDCRIVHLSSGITRCDELGLLRSACDKLKGKGTIIVSAFDNTGAISYPAAFDSVIGVDWSLSCKRIGDFEYVENSPVNIRAIGTEQRVAWLNNDYMMVSGSSFAAPHITAEIIKIIDGSEIKHEDVLYALKLKAKKIYPSQPHIEQDWLFEINSAAVFPFNKEIHSVARFSNLLKFDLYSIYDIKMLGNVGKSLSQIFNNYQKENDLVVNNYDKMNWNGSFDTFILGHIRELSELFDRDFTKEIIKNCIEYKKNLVCFDDLSLYQNEITNLKKAGMKVYYPSITYENVPQNRFGKLRQMGKPVIAIMGTSSKQGKFTLQLILREMFLKSGYKVGQLGTEPSALLFGMDAVYPMGYDSTVTIQGWPAIKVMNHFIGCIEDKNPDIIIVGSQSQTIHYSTGNLLLYSLYNIEMLLACEPDIVILCVNYSDDFAYIQKTISFLEIYQETKVNALVLYPVSKNLRWSVLGNNLVMTDIAELELKANELKQAFSLPVYILGVDEDMGELFQNCVNYF